MGQGMQIFNENGTLKLDMSYSVVKISGIVYIGAGGGAVAVQDIGSNSGRPFATFAPTQLPNIATANINQIPIYPSFTISGNTISWPARANDITLVAGFLMYGVY